MITFGEKSMSIVLPNGCTLEFSERRDSNPWPDGCTLRTVGNGASVVHDVMDHNELALQIQGLAKLETTSDV